MVREADQSAFQKKLEERRAKQAASVPPPPPVPVAPAFGWDQSVQLNDNLSDADKELDAVVDKIDIVSAYIKFCGKMTPDVGNKREGIMVSCPNPAHPDKDPSAWLNLDKQTYFCGGCQEGGDVHDIAALNFGYPVPGYKEGATFHKLREDMAAAFGFRIKKVSGGSVVVRDEPAEVSQPAVTPSPEATPTSPASSPTPSAPKVDADGGIIGSEGVDGDADIRHLYADDDGTEEVVTYPTIDWRNIVHEDTFLYEYMKACCNDDSPEEYHFWHGLLALGLAAGRRVVLDDTQPVFGNLLLCTLGATGTGKSKSRRHLNYVLREVLPYFEDGSATSGVQLVPTPGSGEHLVSSFNYEGKDPSTNKPIGSQPVTGLVDFDEMSALLARANRQGSTLKSTVMQLADAVPEVSIGSLTRGNFNATKPFCTITASTQPKALRAIIGRTDMSSGFLNRWVFAGGKSKEVEALGGARSTIRVDLATAIDKLVDVKTWCFTERSIKMDNDAYDLYVRFFRTIIEPTKVKDPTDLLKRIDLLVKKLMLLLTINLQLDSVPLSVVQVIKPIFDYVIDCYGILNSNIGVTMMQDVMNDILRHIERHQAKTGRGASARDISRYTHRKNYSLEQIKKSLDVMTALDMIELEPAPPGPGRKTTRYQMTASA